jgi:hypothetical protein
MMHRHWCNLLGGSSMIILYPYYSIVVQPPMKFVKELLLILLLLGLLQNGREDATWVEITCSPSRLLIDDF